MKDIMINKTMLEKLGACPEGIKLFNKHFKRSTRAETVINKVHKLKLKNYSYWLFIKFKLSGVSKRFYKHGNLKFKENYKNGQKQGIGKEFYEDGNLWYEENYKNGQEHGVFKCFYENGDLEHEHDYKNGILI